MICPILFNNSVNNDIFDSLLSSLKFINHLYISSLDEQSGKYLEVITFFVLYLFWWGKKVYIVIQDMHHNFLFEKKKKKRKLCYDFYVKCIILKP